MPRNRVSLPIAAALSGALLAACARTPPAATAEPAPTAAPAAAPAPAVADTGAFAFRIGALEAYALKDGDIDVANDGKTFAISEPAEQVAALLSAAGQPTDALRLSIQPLLVRSGARLLLFDTGAAGVSFAQAGRLPASLRAAGVEPAQVTDIFISHAHPDHVGGLRTGEGGLAFANATIHLSRPEWEALQGDPDNAALAAAIAPKVQAFEPNAAIVPGVVAAVAVDGHTPGHSAYEIASGKDRLLYLGDTAHHHVISVQRPEWTVDYDRDAPLAEASRRALLQRAAEQDLHVYSVHFPFPGLGRIKREGDGFAWAADR